ncbi:MAG: hypothetical protein ACREVE_07085 [Gammaproteobacteria bacterium]
MKVELHAAELYSGCARAKRGKPRPDRIDFPRAIDVDHACALRGRLFVSDRLQRLPQLCFIDSQILVQYLGITALLNGSRLHHGGANLLQIALDRRELVHPHDQRRTNVHYPVGGCLLRLGQAGNVGQGAVGLGAFLGSDGISDQTTGNRYGEMTNSFTARIHVTPSIVS